MKSPLLILIVLLVVAGAGVMWFFRPISLPKSAENSTKVSSKALQVKVERRDLVHAITLAGDIQPASQVEVKPEVSGRIKKIYVRAGQMVKMGDVLVELDDRDLLTEKKSADIEIAGTQVNLLQQKRSLERAQKLLAQNLVSQEFYDNANTQLQVAQNNYDRAESRLQIVLDRLAKTKINSPFSGTILSIPVVEGQVVVGAASVSSGTLIMVLADLSSMVITTHVNQVDIAYILPQQQGHFTVEAISDQKMNCTIEFISPMATVKNNVKGFQVQLLIKTPDPRLRPGMTADLSLPVSTANNALSLPLAAVFADDNKGSNVVYVAGKAEEKPRKQEVTLGIVNYDYAEIKSGLGEGDVVFLTKPKGG
jgi:RND family efflux transporter MFP subunit